MEFKMLSKKLSLCALIMAPYAYSQVRAIDTKNRKPAQSVACDDSQFSIWIRGSDSRFRDGKKEFFRTGPEEFPKVITKDSGLFDEILFKGSEISDTEKTQVRISLRAKEKDKDLKASVASFKLRAFDGFPDFYRAELVDINSYIQKLYSVGGGVIAIEAIREKASVYCKIEIAVEFGH